MPEYIKVKDRPDLVRDKGSKAILSTDLDGLNKYREERNFKQRVERVIHENEQIKADLAEIKQLLVQIAGQK